MRNVATISARDREAQFRNTAAKMGVSEAIIEKDFWGCYMLDYLFHRCAWKDNLAFKGRFLPFQSPAPHPHETMSKDCTV